jgi:hypothetical protein
MITAYSSDGKTRIQRIFGEIVTGKTEIGAQKGEEE